MNRIVITNICMVNSLGLSSDEIWSNLKNNKNGFSEIQGFDISGLDTKIGGEIKQLIGEKNKWRKIFDLLFEQLQFIDNSIPIIIGSTFFGIEEDKFYNQNLVIEDIKKKYNFKNIIFNTNTCASGNFILDSGKNLIKYGKFNKVYVCAIDILTKYLFSGFSALRNLSKNEPKPFSINRDGLGLGEGGSLIELQNLKYAIKNNSQIYCELGESGYSCDTVSITGIDKTGNGIKKCLWDCLTNNKLKPEHIDLISSHGTGTKLNDEIEAKIIKEIFGDKVYIQAMKSFWGHSISSSPLVEASIIAFCIKNNYLIKIRNLDTPQIKLNYLIENKNEKIYYAINNSFGFGGINSALLLKRCSYE